MKVIIDICEDDYWLACNHPDILIGSYAHAIRKGIRLPEKHGRLIDADALTKELEQQEKYNTSPQFAMELTGILCDIRNAPTIVEAEGEE